jgi:nitroreductase
MEHQRPDRLQHQRAEVRLQPRRRSTDAAGADDGGKRSQELGVEAGKRTIPYSPRMNQPIPHPTVTAPASELIDRLNWRYAAKKMDPAKAVPQDKVERILEAARLAPTSSGLQPYEIFVVTDPAVRARIQPIAWNQAQITDGSHLLVFAAWDHYTAERINHMFDLTNEVRGFRSEGWENYRNMLLSSYPQRDPEVNFQHAARQAYIGLSAAMVAAAFEEVDCTPMEGFDPAALDEILGLRARGLRSAVILPLGYRQPEGDWLVNLQKVRRPRSAFITEV